LNITLKKEFTYYADFKTFATIYQPVETVAEKSCWEHCNRDVLQVTFLKNPGHILSAKY